MKEYQKLLIGLILVVVIAIGVNYDKAYSFLGVESNGESMDLGIPVESAEVIKEKLTEKLSYMGTVYPKETVEVASKISGQIADIPVKEGDMVKKGQILAKLDSSHINAKIATIEAKMATIQYNLKYMIKEEERYEVLAEGGGISLSAYEKISHERGMLEMQLRELYAAKDELIINLKDTVLTSPMEGKIRAINNSMGDLAVTGKPIVVLDNTLELMVKANISESDLKRVKVETPVSMEISGVEGKIKAKVTRVVSSINPKTRIGEIEVGNIRLKDNKDIILGSSVDMDFILNEVDKGYTIPINAVKELSGERVVYQLVDNKVQEVPIVTGLRIDNRVQVVEGLEEGDKVAVSNIDKLYDNAKVYLFKGDQGQ